MEFKDRIRMLRNEKGMNTTALAAVFGKSDTAIRMWETGRSKPDVDTLIKLAGFFDCTTDYLLGLSDIKSEISIRKQMKSYENLESSLNSTLPDIAIDFSEKICVLINKSKSGIIDDVLIPRASGIIEQIGYIAKAYCDALEEYEQDIKSFPFGSLELGEWEDACDSTIDILQADFYRTTHGINSNTSVEISEIIRELGDHISYRCDEFRKERARMYEGE